MTSLDLLLMLLRSMLPKYVSPCGPGKLRLISEWMCMRGMRCCRI